MQKHLVLVLNCGSSSIKFAIIDTVSSQKLFYGLVERIGAKDAGITWTISENKQQHALPEVHYHEALDFILELMRARKDLFTQICAVGHRVVHGGERFVESVIINNDVLAAIKDCQDLAPLHNPANILGIKAAKQAFPKLPHVAVFDTAFHQTMPQYAYLYAIPYDLYTKHQVRRYGFHGTSYRFVAARAAEFLEKPLEKCNLIVAHLGNGSSVCAILAGKSVDTSMGLTPIEGLVMGTRSGDVDPSIHAYLVDKLGYDIHKVNTMLNKESGLLGVSGINSDMRSLEAASKKGDKQASLAIDIYCYRLAKYIGAYAVVLGSFDALVFTGGIGENSACVRAKTLGWLSILNFTVDEKLNAEHGNNSMGVITTDVSSKALVINTNEELMIAQDAIGLTNKTEV